jgi:hypothetical protein
MKLISITPSSNPDKKLMAKFLTDTGRERTTHFGQAGADDYSISKNKEQRQRYMDRHKKDLETGDPTRAGFLSYYILWGESTSRQANIAAFKKRFNL